MFMIISREFVAKPLQQMHHNVIFRSTIVPRFVGTEKFVKCAALNWLLIESHNSRYINTDIQRERTYVKAI
jgi:hypothetical protein